MLAYRILALAARPCVRIVFRPQVEGRQHVPEVGGVVVGATHLSGFDVLAIAYALVPRPVRFMAKNQLFRRRLLGAVVRALGAFPARDVDSVSGGVAAACDHVANGGVVVIFPEGARRRGRDRRPLTGAARTALATEAPLLPAAIRGTDGWRGLRRWQIAIGAPIPLAGIDRTDPDTAAQKATALLWGGVTALEAGLER